jgi:hypothetical protein
MMGASTLLFAAFLAGICGLAWSVEVLYPDTGPGDSYKGWRMKDRFMGLRYEITGEFNRKNLMQRLVRKADELSGFGWVQESPRTHSLVGEFRGSKYTSPHFIEFLKNPTKTVKGPDYDVYTYVYEDTKIRFHFSHFKIVEPERVTCFDEAPHKCSPDEHRRLQEEL